MCIILLLLSAASCCWMHHTFMLSVSCEILQSHDLNCGDTNLKRSQPNSLRRARTLCTSYLATVTPCVTLSREPRLGGLQSRSRPVQLLSASARGSVLWQTMTLGTSVFGSESRGRGILSSRPPVEESRCHPVPIDSTGGVLFLGRSHPRLLPRSICMTPARQRQIWLCFPDGISSDITFGIPRSSQAGRSSSFFFLFLSFFSSSSALAACTH